jgi:branched-chain amino acid aminotransferase
MLDLLGNVAEFGNANVFMARDGAIYMPVPNGTFLNGITRQRVIELARRRRHGG